MPVTNQTPADAVDKTIEELDTMEVKDEESTVNADEPEDTSESSENETESDDDGSKSDESTDEGNDDEQSESNDDESEKGKPVTPKVEVKADTKDNPDIEHRYVEASKEAIVLRSRNKQQNEAIEAALSLPEPSEEQLKKEYPEWEDLSDFNKQMAKRTLHSRLKDEKLKEALLSGKKVDDWLDQIDTFLDNPTNMQSYPSLEGKEDDFRRFASRETRIGVDFDVLVRAFSFDLKPNQPNKNRKEILLSGSGGGKTETKPAWTAEKVSVLRKNNPREYNRLVAAGKIQITI
jgi:hypothetical protein